MNEERYVIYYPLLGKFEGQLDRERVPLGSAYNFYSRESAQRWINVAHRFNLVGDCPLILPYEEAKAVEGIVCLAQIASMGDRA